MRTNIFFFFRKQDGGNLPIFLPDYLYVLADTASKTEIRDDFEVKAFERPVSMRTAVSTPWRLLLPPFLPSALNMTRSLQAQASSSVTLHACYKF